VLSTYLLNNHLLTCAISIPRILHKYVIVLYVPSGTILRLHLAIISIDIPRIYRLTTPLYGILPSILQYARPHIVIGQYEETLYCLSTISDFLYRTDILRAVQYIAILLSTLGLTLNAITSF